MKFVLPVEVVLALRPSIGEFPGTGESEPGVVQVLLSPSEKMKCGTVRQAMEELGGDIEESGTDMEANISFAVVTSITSLSSSSSSSGPVMWISKGRWEKPVEKTGESNNSGDSGDNGSISRLIGSGDDTGIGSERDGTGIDRVINGDFVKFLSTWKSGGGGSISTSTLNDLMSSVK
jgi:hypothetical protein